MVEEIKAYNFEPGWYVVEYAEGGVDPARLRDASKVLADNGIYILFIPTHGGDVLHPIQAVAIEEL